MVILGGAAALLLLLLLVVVIDGGSDGTTSSGSDGTTAPPAQLVRTIFADDFSDDAGGWLAEGDGEGSQVDGSYQIRVRSENEDGIVGSLPVKASTVHPTAPADLRIEATVQRIEAAGPSAAMAVMCRAGNGSFYGFLMGRDYVSIAKYTDTEPYFEELDDGPLPAAPTAATRLKAECRTEGSAQHLTFFVNDKKVVDVTDTKNPLPPGAVGLAAITSNGPGSIVARFDDFSVTAA